MPTSALVHRQALDSVTASNAKLMFLVRDVHAMLVAEERSQAGDEQGAQASWFEALQSARGSFGKQALAGWLRSYTNNLGKTAAPAVLARLIMAETQQGRVSPYMQERGLTSDRALMPVLQATVPRWLTAAKEPPSAGSTAAGQAAAPPVLPALGGGPPGDVLLIKTAVRACRTQSQTTPAWTAWRDHLDAPVRSYWLGLLAEKCGAGPVAAIELYRQAYPKLGLDLNTLGLALEAAGRTAALQRANGLRTEAADTYRDLVALWGKDGVKASALGLDEMALSLRRMDETLWAARYRSLIGDYETAKIYAQAALDQGKLLAVKRSQYKKSVREQLAALRADGYHTLAYRVAVEQQEFARARSLALIGLALPDLPEDWHERLSWLAGLYDYLDGNYASAAKRWEQLLGRTHDDGLRAAIYFWSARSLQKIGNRIEAAQQIQQLEKLYPLGYYAVVAAPAAGLSDAGHWSEPFGDLEQLPRMLAKRRDFHLQSLRESATLAPLLSRAEILCAAGLRPYAKQAVVELEQALAAALPLRAHESAYVYLSRLQYLAGNYLAAIGLTGKLSKQSEAFWREWPEQMLVFFAAPYDEEYRYNAEVSGVARELLLGISRQESGFTPDIRSNANAIGLMQLIPPTARRFAAELALPTDHIEALLQDPASNIRIGSRYLKWLSMHYRGFPAAVYGGYNAGEYAVDLWLKRRAHSDPLMFIELIPFGETKDYVKSVWRNVLVYHELIEGDVKAERPGFDLGFAGTPGA